jgi:hypothetical protein
MIIMKNNEEVIEWLRKQRDNAHKEIEKHLANIEYCNILLDGFNNNAIIEKEVEQVKQQEEKQRYTISSGKSVLGKRVLRHEILDFMKSKPNGCCVRDVINEFGIVGGSVRSALKELKKIGAISNENRGFYKFVKDVKSNRRLDNKVVDFIYDGIKSNLLNSDIIRLIKEEFDITILHANVAYYRSRHDKNKQEPVEQEPVEQEPVEQEPVEQESVDIIISPSEIKSNGPTTVDEWKAQNDIIKCKLSGRISTKACIKYMAVHKYDKEKLITCRSCDHAPEEWRKK